MALSVSGFIIFNNFLDNKKSSIVEQVENMNLELLNRRSISEIQQDLEFAQTSKEFFKNLYLDYENLLDFIENLESIARSREVSLNIISVDKNSLNENSEFLEKRTEVFMPLRFQGEWDQVLNFLISLESLPYFITISEFEIRNINRAEALYEASLKIKILTK